MAQFPYVRGRGGEGGEGVSGRFIQGAGKMKIVQIFLYCEHEIEQKKKSQLNAPPDSQ